MMHRPLIVLTLVAVSCQATDFTLDYTFSDGPARVHTALTIRGNEGIIFLHVGEGTEKSLRLAHQPEVLERARPFIGASYPLTEAGKPIPGMIRIAPGNTLLVSIPMTRKDG